MFFPWAPRFVLSSCVVAFLTAALAAAGQQSPINATRGQLAVRGYDVVAYTSVQRMGERDIPGNVAKAGANCTGVLGK